MERRNGRNLNKVFFFPQTQGATNGDQQPPQTAEADTGGFGHVGAVGTWGDTGLSLAENAPINSQICVFILPSSSASITIHICEVEVRADGRQLLFGAAC